MSGLPYSLTVWCGYHREVARFREFDLAASTYRNFGDSTKQLVNLDRADSGRSGLTENERQALEEAP